jgi:hypothetical protein
MSLLETYTHYRVPHRVAGTWLNHRQIVERHPADLAIIHTVNTIVLALMDMFIEPFRVKARNAPMLIMFLDTSLMVSAQIIVATRTTMECLVPATAVALPRARIVMMTLLTVRINIPVIAKIAWMALIMIVIPRSTVLILIA